MTAEPTWATMSRNERIDLLCHELDGAELVAVRARLCHFFRGRSLDDFHFAMNVMLRECWRHEHGDTAEWDRAAAAGGVVIR